MASGSRRCSLTRRRGCPGERAREGQGVAAGKPERHADICALRVYLRSYACVAALPPDVAPVSAHSRAPAHTIKSPDNTARPPSWDGNPRSFKNFCQDFEWHVHTVKVFERHYIVARTRPSRDLTSPSVSLWTESTPAGMTFARVRLWLKCQSRRTLRTSSSETCV